MDIRNIVLTIDWDMFHDELEKAMFTTSDKADEVKKIIKKMKELCVAHEIDPNKFVNVHLNVKAHEFD